MFSNFWYEAFEETSWDLLSIFAVLLLYFWNDPRSDVLIIGFLLFGVLRIFAFGINAILCLLRHFLCCAVYLYRHRKSDERIYSGSVSNGLQ